MFREIGSSKKANLAATNSLDRVCRSRVTCQSVTIHEIGLTHDHTGRHSHPGRSIPHLAGA